MGAYFDAVLDKDLNPVFNGTAEETKVWLAEQKMLGNVKPDWSVIPGIKFVYMTVDDYLKA
jgi:hypothetical protein